MTNDLKQVRDEINVIRKVIIDLASSNNREDVDVAQTYQNGLAKCVNIMTTLDRLIAEPSGDVAAALDKMEAWEYFTDGAYWDMCAVRPVGDTDFNSSNLFHVSNLKEGERLASLLNKRTEQKEGK